MVHIRLLSIVIGFLFLMNGISDYSFALAQDEATARNGLAAIDQEHDVSALKELVDDHQRVTGISMRKLWLQGRKIAAQMVWKEHEKEEIGMRKLGAFKLSGASHSGGNFDFEGGGDFNSKSKFEDHKSCGSSCNYKLNNAAGFVAFNSDYHGPKRHPPIHN